jgi:hypothetical protein
MLFLKRLATSFALFLLLFVVLFIGSLAVGGAIVGLRAHTDNPGAKDFRSGYELGHKAGSEFGRKYGPIFFIGAFGVSAVGSLALSFSGVFPWCRRPK